MEQQAIANVLIVDDHPENVLAMEAVLAELDANLVKAYSGQEALKAVLSHDFAVILLDVQMAGMDGFETAALIKKREKSRQTPIIFVTAINRTEAHIFQGYGVGAVDYLFKPLVPEVLRAKVSVFIDLFRKTVEIKAQAAALAAANAKLETQLDEVRRLNRELASLNHELESFSYSVSHDLRAPLRSVTSFTQALMQDYHKQFDEQGQYYIDCIQAACTRMRELIDALLQLSRFSRETLRIASVDLSALASQIANTLCDTEPARAVDFTIEPSLTVEGDGRLLRVMLENLLGNAWKFTRQKADARIEFGSFFQKGNSRVFYIRDNGAGFDMEYSDQLFLPFQRLHLDSEFEGTGIGLATVQRIVQRHHGDIWAEAAADEGATFYFTLS